MMKYENLHELVNRSRSTRRYFLSLPVEMQMTLGEYHDAYIHSAEELHRRVCEIEACEHLASLSDWNREKRS